MPWGSMGSIWAEMGLDYSGLGRGIDESGRLIDKFEREAQNRFKNISNTLAKDMQRLGRDMTLYVSAPISVFGGMAAKGFADFESSLANVWTIADISKRELKDLGDEIEDLSRRVPQSATQLAEGLYDAIGSGITNLDDAMTALEISAKAGMAGASDTATAMDALTSILNSYGKSVSEAGIVTDIMFRTVDIGKISFGELAGSIGQVVSTAATAKVPFEEIAAAFATLTKGGINAAESSTAVNQSILSIIQPSREAADYANQLGIEFNAAALESKGFVGVLQEVYDATGGNIEALSTLFPNVRALKGVLGLVRNEMQDYTSDLDAMAASAGATEAAFKKQMDTSAAQSKLFKNEVSALSRSIGEELWPVLNRGMAILKPLVQDFTNLPGPVKESAVGFGLVAAAAGPLVAGIGALISVMSGPAGIVVAIAAVTAAVTGIIRTSQDLEGQIERQVSAAKRAIGSALDSAQAYKSEADQIDHLIKEYEDLQGKPDKSEEEHERLRKVIDQIVELCPEAASGYDDMGRALMDNADNAKRYRDELYKLQEQQLKIAAARAKYELPELKRQAEALKPDLERAKQQLDELFPLYDKASDLMYKMLDLNRQEDEAISKRDRAAQEAIQKQRELILQDAVNAGIITSTMEPFAARVIYIRDQYESVRDTYTSLLSTQQTAIKGIMELTDAEKKLQEFQNLNKETGATTTTTEGTETTGGTGDPTAGIGDLPSRIKGLAGDAYKTLREAWLEIEKGLKSQDIVDRIVAEDKAGKLTDVLTDKIIELGGDFETAALEAVKYIENGWQEIDHAANMSKRLDQFRAKVSIEGLDTKEQIAGLEAIKAAYQDAGVDMTQIEVQLAELRKRLSKEAEQQRQKDLQGVMDTYRFEAQLYDYSAQNHIDHLNRLLQNEQMTAEERKRIEQDLALWKKKQLDEQIQAEKATYELLNSMGLVSLDEQISHHQRLVDATTAGTDDRAKAVQDYYSFLMATIATATDEELNAIKATLQAQLIKYEAMGQGSSQAAMAIRAALDEISYSQNWRSWMEPWERTLLVLDGLASELDSAGSSWGRFAAMAIRSIKMVSDETTGLLDFTKSLKVSWGEFVKSMEQTGLQGIGSSIGNILTGKASTGDKLGLAGAGIGAIFGAPGIGQAIGSLVGGIIDLFKEREKPSASIQTRVGSLAKEFREYERGGEKYYKSGWDEFWGKKSYDLEKTFQDIAKILGTTIDDMASSLSSAFQADTYEDFVSNFSQSIEQQTMQALTTAFMASGVMKPLLDNLSRTITEAAMDAELTEEEKARIRNQIADISNVAEPFYDMLLEMFPDLYDIEEAKDKQASGSRGTQISEITGPTRDLLLETLRPITALDVLPNYFISMERAIIDMKDAFLMYIKETSVVSKGTASIVNEYHIQKIVINAKDDENFDDIMESLGKRADLALAGSGG